MSYILDALRKADSERERGEVPGLHAQPRLPTAGESTPHGINRKLIWAVAVLAGLLTTTLLAMFWGRTESGAPTPAPGNAPQPMAMSQQPLPTEPTPPSHNQAPGPAQSSMSSADTIETPAEPKPPQSGSTPPPGVFPPVKPPTEPQPTATAATANMLPKTTAAVPAPVQAPPPSTAPATSARALLGAPPATGTPASPKTADEGRIMTVQELPESVRRELPTITIGGAMYSDTPSQRVLIINSQVLHEGDKISPELSLEQIKLKSAVFRFRNYRYVVNY